MFVFVRFIKINFNVNILSMRSKNGTEAFALCSIIATLFTKYSSICLYIYCAFS